MNRNVNFNRIFIIILSFVGIISMLGMTVEESSNELSTSYETELELKSIINQYGEDNIIFEDGIALQENEVINISDMFQEILSESELIIKNEEIISLNEYELIGEKEGTTFLIIRKNDKYHVIEVYVTSEESLNIPSLYSSEIKDYYRVYVDAGHGGSDPGAVKNGVNEKDINLSIALKVRDKLVDLGVEVIMNRDKDVYVNFRDTVIHANTVNPDIFISIHQNSATATSANGIETFYTKEIDKELANEIQSKLIENTNAVNRGVKYNIFHVTRYTNMPAVLTENGFISNVLEAEKLKTDKYQEAIADAIVEGAMIYLEENVEIASDKIPSERIYGENRYQTSYEIFRKGWSSAENIILTTGTDYPDALSATPLSAKYDAPILLINNESLNNQKELKDLIEEKGVKNAYIIGGEGIIPSTIEDELSDLGITSKRLGGKDRYETSVIIAKELGSTTGEIAVANGLDFVDGLSISSIAAMRNMPILLINSDRVPVVVEEYMKTINVNKSYIVGATAVISNEVEKSFKNAERLGGANRYETNISIFNKFKDELDISNVYMASGLDFADALSSAPLASKNNTFMFLTHPTTVNKNITATLEQNKSRINNVYVLGSDRLISTSVLNGLGIFESR